MLYLTWLILYSLVVKSDLLKIVLYGDIDRQFLPQGLLTLSFIYVRILIISIVI